MIGGAAERDFDSAQLAKQLDRLALVTELDHAIEKLFRAGFATDRLRFINCGGEQGFAKRQQLPNFLSRSFQVLEAIAEIRTDRHAGSHALLERPSTSCIE